MPILIREITVTYVGQIGYLNDTQDANTRFAQFKEKKFV